jgi:hypothetical protein
MQLYPETLALAALCAEPLGDREGAEAYSTRKAGLRNEYALDVDKRHLLPE